MAGHLWLVGMMGSGKTSVGIRLAQRLERAFFDVDDDIVDRLGCSIPQLWGERGEGAFRDLETAAIDRLADEAPAVIATGGGAVLSPANVARMRTTGRIVWLTAAASTLAERVGGATGRPLLRDDDPASRLAAILELRNDLYAAAADFTISTEGCTLDETAERIEEWWNAS